MVYKPNKKICNTRRRAKCVRYNMRRFEGVRIMIYVGCKSSLNSLTALTLGAHIVLKHPYNSLPLHADCSNYNELLYTEMRYAVQ